MAERRCIATGEVGRTGSMVRFVVGPEGAIVPDVAGKLPGRGIWVRASRAAVDRAVSRRLFARAAKAPVQVDPGLAGQVETLLLRRCLEFLGLARRAGLVVTGYEKVRDKLQRGEVAWLLAAADGAAEGRGKLRRLAADTPVLALLTSEELSLALGRENVVHAALAPGGLAERFAAEAMRLAGFRSDMPPTVAAGLELE